MSGKSIKPNPYKQIIAIEKVWETFKEAKNIVVVSPANYDPDSICSCLLLERLFSHRGMGIPRPHLFFCAQKPKAKDNALLKFVEPQLELFSDTPPTAYTVPLHIVVVDHGNFSTCRINPRELPYHYFIGLDHHSEPAPDFPANGIQICDPDMPSTTALIYELFRQKSFPITQEMALYVALGIMSDTGRMTNSKTNAHAFQIMADCINIGIPWREIQKAAAPKMTRQRIKIWAKAEKDLNPLTEQVISLVVYKRTLAEWNGTKKDIDTFFGQMVLLEGVEIAVLIFEETDGSWKISFRSNSPETCPAAEFAKLFNGGGHAHAAAAIYRGDPFDAERMILSYVETKTKQA